MQISKKFQQNVNFYAIILWQKDLKADEVSLPSWSLFTTVTLSLKYVLNAPICCLKRKAFIPLRVTALRKPEICFLPAKMALARSAMCKPSSPLWHYQTLLPLLVLLMGAVLYYLYCQSAPLARIWRWSWVWDSVMPIFMLAILFREAVQCWSKCAAHHCALDAR